MRVSSRLPRGVRIPAVLLVGLLVVSGMGWGLFVHNPAPSEPQRPAFLAAPGEPLPAPVDNESYRVTVRMKSDFPQVRNVEIVRQKEYVPRARQAGQPVIQDSQMVRGSSDVVQYVSYRDGQQQYVRKTFADRQAFRESADRPGVVRVDSGSLTYYRVDQSASTSKNIQPREAIEGLYLLRYERVGTTTYNGRTVVKYVATEGWTTRSRLDGQGSQSLYVREASGTVLVAAEDNAILHANVTGSIVKASSWAGVMTQEAYTVTIEYEVTTDIGTVSKPPWVNSLNQSAPEDPE